MSAAGAVQGWPRLWLLPVAERPLLVERAGFAGGIITAVGLPYFDGLMEKKTGRFVVGGIPTRAAAADGRLRAGRKTHRRLPAGSDHKILDVGAHPQHRAIQAAWPTACSRPRATGCKSCFTASAAMPRAAGRIQAVVVANKDGLVRIEARQVDRLHRRRRRGRVGGSTDRKDAAADAADDALPHRQREAGEANQAAAAKAARRPSKPADCRCITGRD